MLADRVSIEFIYPRQGQGRLILATSICRLISFVFSGQRLLLIVFASVSILIMANVFASVSAYVSVSAIRIWRAEACLKQQPAAAETHR